MADANALVVRRYDRTEDERKIHAEDFAQVLTIKPKYNYERFTYSRTESGNLPYDQVGDETP